MEGADGGRRFGVLVLDDLTLAAGFCDFPHLEQRFFLQTRNHGMQYSRPEAALTRFQLEKTLPAHLHPGAGQRFDLAVLVKDGDASACLVHGVVRGGQIHLVDVYSGDEAEKVAAALNER